ncbi:baculoviral IAP repeat-containing protein 7-B-like [Neocloeon triangulifer]|uniref:baculoviral IAP repeat-containing protein 7-B-like n=1 Tax=Neocloeon triangulifer TaxID=2078957 RepID=UPI00286EE8F5|nr:baculoviral IAP repeat-containing protein 7-B-like [Neocloeon triangulifer]
MPQLITREKPYNPGQYGRLNTKNESHRCLTYPKEHYEKWGKTLENLASNGFYLTKSGENFNLSCHFCFNIKPLVLDVDQMFTFAQGKDVVQISEWHLRRATYCKCGDPGGENFPRKRVNVFESERACSLLAATFNNPGLWKVSPYDLARDGFYLYDPDANNDRVKCTSCEVVVGNWQETDNAHEEHVKAAAGNECDFIDGTPKEPKNVPVYKETYYRYTGGRIQGDEPLNDLLLRGGGWGVKDAEFPKFASLEDRAKSFTSMWPLKESIPASRMAACGFFYAGQEDKTICYFCGIALHKWTPGDNPKAEHAKYNPDCTTLRGI